MKIVLTFLVIVGYADIATGGGGIIDISDLNPGRTIGSWNWDLAQYEDTYLACSETGVGVALGYNESVRYVYWQYFPNWEYVPFCLHTDATNGQNVTITKCCGFNETIQCEEQNSTDGVVEMQFNLAEFYQKMNESYWECQDYKDSYNRCNGQGTRLAGEMYEGWGHNLTETFVEVYGDEEVATAECLTGYGSRTIECESVLTDSGAYKMKFNLYDFFETLDYVYGKCLEDIYSKK